MIYLTGEQVCINVHQKKILLAISGKINSTDSLPLRQVLLGFAGTFGLDLELVVLAPNVVVPKLRRAKMRLMVVSLGGFSLSPIAQCDGLEARPRPGRKPAVVEVEMTGNAECDELTEWHEVGWIY